MNYQIKIVVEFEGGKRTSEYILPEKKLTFSEASLIGVIIDGLISIDLCEDKDFKHIFNNRYIKEYSAGIETEDSYEKPCKLPEVPAQNPDL